ncbi:hypothetical protein ANCDUO_17904 [Ancylostoma duodenale]|uniref:RRM domain-containing protein n=1 Tax=Ancylostoma duodenale TaxID=51022 RepID=A0A0C2CQF3_9BILA|nr:hypothetical protein ANCDUO_17904 [Ancylostoma duodenale]
MGSSRLQVEECKPFGDTNKPRAWSQYSKDSSDCTLKYTKEGKFRKFAFVGFDSEENAKKALQETNHSYMGSSRLQVLTLQTLFDTLNPIFHEMFDR